MAPRQRQLGLGSVRLPVGSCDGLGRADAGGIRPHTGSTETAAIERIGRTGRLVTSAALILFLAFVAFALQPGTEAKIFATALGGGIL